MKTTNFQARLASLAVALTCLPLPIALAGDTNSTPAAAPVAVPAPADASTQTAVGPPKLPSGVEDVLKLSHSQVGDDIVVNYIRNTGTIYVLSPQDIIYLRNQGVSDRVINAMIEQRKAVTAENPPPAQAPSTAAPFPGGSPAPHSTAELIESQQGRTADAPLCLTCGTKMRPAGSCYVCEGCGSTSGCS